MNILKVAIWATTIVGLAPAILLAVLTLTSNISLARHIKGGGGFEHDDGGSAYFTHSYIELGKTLRLEVTSSIWPSVCLLAGAGVFVSSLLFVIPPQSQVREARGFEKIQKYVESVMNSRSPYAYVVISPSGDEYTAVDFSKDGDGLSLGFSLTDQQQAEPLLEFFANRGIEPAEDYLTEPGTEWQSRHLSFPTEGTAEEVAAICTSILIDVFGTERGRDLLFSIGR